MERYVIIILIITILYIITKSPKYNRNNKLVVEDKHIKPSNLLVVAHPDDETLWGYTHVYQNPKSWKVICLTCANNTKRINEFKKIMEQLGIPNYEIWDHENSIFVATMNKLCFNDLEKDIINNEYKLIVTHNSYGEYGNLQHMSAHRAIKKLKDKHSLPVKFF